MINTRTGYEDDIYNDTMTQTRERETETEERDVSYADEISDAYFSDTRYDDVTEMPEETAPRRVETTDSMPSSTTMDLKDSKENVRSDAISQYGDEIYDDFEEDTKKGFTLSTRQKIFITLYTLIVVGIIALIAFNASALNRINREIEDTEQAVVELTAKNRELEDTLEYVSSDEVIAAKAEQELGMTKLG